MNDLFILGEYFSQVTIEAEAREDEDEFYYLPAVNVDRPDVIMVLENAIEKLSTDRIAYLIERSKPSTRRLLEKMRSENIILYSEKDDLWGLRLEYLPIIKYLESGDRSDFEIKKRRSKGEGTGFIIERLSQGKYPQYHFCWVEHRPNGEIKKHSKYIKKNLLAKIREMNEERIPIDKILESL